MQQQQQKQQHTQPQKQQQQQISAINDLIGPGFKARFLYQQQQH